MKKIRFTAILTAAALLLTSCSSSEEIAYDPSVDETTTTTVTTATEAQEEVTTTSTTKAETTTTETTTEKTTVETTTAETTVTTTTTAATTTTAVTTTWTEQAVNKVMYVNTNGIYSRKYAIQGSTTVKQYKLNDKVTVVALTNTDYYKLNDGSFIHKDYLSSSEIVITTTTATTTTAAVANPTSIETLLNNAPLHPMKTNEPDMDKWTEELLGQITTDSMTTYQKVKAVYDYLINNVEYAMGYRSWADVTYVSDYDQFVVDEAASILLFEKGVCENYSSAFMVLTRAIGLDSYIMIGRVKAKAGGTAAHVWAYIKINGAYYAFDPQVEQSNRVNGQIQYWFFGRSDESAASLYTVSSNTTVSLKEDREDLIKDFRNFEIVG